MLLVSLMAGCGSESDSNMASGSGVEPVINPPTNLMVKVFSAQEIRLFWDDNSNSEEGFIVEKSRDNISFSEVGRVTAGIVAFSDFTVAQNQNIYYRIAAYQGARTSIYSEVTKAFHYIFDACQSSPTVQSVTSGKIYPLSVTGLNYVSDNYSAVTDQYSSYTYGADNATKFSIGYIPIAQINPKQFLALGDIATNMNPGTNAPNNVEMNLLRLLLALDDDNNSSNGIQLPCHLSTASGDIDFSLDAVSFENQSDVLVLLNGKSIPTQLEAMALLRSAKSKYYSGNYSIYFSKYQSGMILIANGRVDFTLNTDGTITVTSFSGDGLGWIKSADFLPDNTVNLYFRAGDSAFYYDLRIDANIEPNHNIAGTFRLFGLLGDVPGSVIGYRF